MLVKANLINGESKILAAYGISWDEIVKTKQLSAEMWYKSIMSPLNVEPHLNVAAEYLNSLGISNIETLTFDEEIKIQEKLNSQEGENMFNKKYGSGYIDNSNLETLRNNPPGDPPKQPIYASGFNNIQVYSISDLALLKDRDIITQEEFKRLARKMVGLDKHET